MNERDDLPALAELGSRLEAARGAQRQGLRPQLWRPAFVLPAVLALIVGLMFTPPGRAVTGEIAELVGVGEVGGPPSEPSRVGDFDPASEQVVLAVGETADGVRYEIVAYRSDRDVGEREDGAVCVNVEWLGPGTRSDLSGSCYAGTLRYGAICCSAVSWANEEPTTPTAVPWAEGQISPRVDSVEVSYVDAGEEDRTVEAVVGMITPEIAELLKIEHPSGKFFASLPSLAEQGGVPAYPGGATYRAPAHPVVVSTFDQEGEPLESETIRPVSGRDIERIERLGRPLGALQEPRGGR